MPELALIFVSGLLGSAHCVGMCGGFAVALGTGAPSNRAVLGRQLIYSAGRVTTYGLLGAMAGFGGLWLAERVGPLVHLQAILALLAGAVLIVEGLRAGGWWPRRGRSAGQGASAALPCLAGSMLRPLLSGSGLTGPLVAGMATVLLPCGLLYAFLALAASTGSLTRGWLVMSSFALGTAPLMIAVGWLGPALMATRRGLAWRGWLVRAAAASVLLVGCITVARGVGFLSLPGRQSPPGCPACTLQATATPATVPLAALPLWSASADPAWPDEARPPGSPAPSEPPATGPPKAAESPSGR